MLARASLVTVRLLRTLLVFKLGLYAGFATAAAIMKRSLPSRGDEESDEVTLVAVFDGIKLRNRSQAFRGGSMLAWYGGVDVDLTEAELAPGATLRLTALFGGIAVRIPAGWRVESNAKALLGGVDVRTRDADQPDAPTLTIDGIAALGGISVGAKQAEAAAAA
jgi:hypothetical protein